MRYNFVCRVSAEGQQDDFGVADINALAHGHGFCGKSPSDLPIGSLVRLSSPDYTLCSIRSPMYHKNNYEYTPKDGQIMASYGTKSRLMVMAAGCSPDPDKSRSMCTEPRVPDVNALKLMNSARTSAVPSKNA